MFVAWSLPIRHSTGACNMERRRLARVHGAQRRLGALQEGGREGWRAGGREGGRTRGIPVRWLAKDSRELAGETPALPAKRSVYATRRLPSIEPPALPKNAIFH